jgi:signal transduction histidine kinase
MNRRQNTALASPDEVFTSRIPEILQDYEHRLRGMNSPLVGDDARTETLGRAEQLLAACAQHLRGSQSRRTFFGDTQPTQGWSELYRTASDHLTDILQGNPDQLALQQHALSGLTSGLIALTRITAASDDSTLLDLAHTARTSEHQRLAGELHDRIGAGISLALRRLELYEARHSTPESQVELRDIGHALEELYQQTRLLVAGLRPHEIETTIEVALKNFVHQTEPACEVELVVCGDESLVPPDYQDEIFMVMREGLRNAFAHAHATCVIARLDVMQGQVFGVVEDNGVGLATLTSRHSGGLRSMRARVEALGGAFEVMSHPAAGCRIRISIPLLERHGVDGD